MFALASSRLVAPHHHQQSATTSCAFARSQPSHSRRRCLVVRSSAEAEGERLSDGSEWTHHPRNRKGPCPSLPDPDAELEKRLERLRTAKGATPYGQSAKQASAKEEVSSSKKKGQECSDVDGQCRCCHRNWLTSSAAPACSPCANAFFFCRGRSQALLRLDGRDRLLRGSAAQGRPRRQPRARHDPGVAPADHLCRLSRCLCQLQVHGSEDISVDKGALEM